MACSSMFSTIPSLFTAVFVRNGRPPIALHPGCERFVTRLSRPRRISLGLHLPVFVGQKPQVLAQRCVFFEGRNQTGWVNQRNNGVQVLCNTGIVDHILNMCVCAAYIGTIYHTQRNIEASKVESFSPWRWQPGDAPSSTLLQISLSSTSKDSLANNSDWARNHKVFKSWSLWPYLKYFTYISVWGKGVLRRLSKNVQTLTVPRYVEVAARRRAISSQ